MKEKKQKEELQQTLNMFVEEGYQADTARVKKDMCAQFADPRECAREYVVNASDAGAQMCIVRGRKVDGIITLTVIDNGCGMDEKGVRNFFRVYHSAKDHPNSKAVGRHGIGKLSVAALPGQCRFEMYTSTGTETFLATTGSLLEEEPIKISRLTPEKDSGTTFRISFKSSNSLKKEMESYRDILKKYVPFLPMLTQVWIPESDEENCEHIPEFINLEWPGSEISYYKTYQETVLDKPVTIVLGVGPTTNILYQNGVMITEKYNLYNHGQADAIVLPGLSVQVDSPAFELPFGRHCLSNEDILYDIVYAIKNRLVPDFYRELTALYRIGDLQTFNFSNHSFELLTSALLYQDEDRQAPWFDVPVVKCVNQKVLSLNDIFLETSRGKSIYVANPKATGFDFSVFDGPVLLNEQTGYITKVLTRFFEDKIKDLSLNSLVLEQPGATRNQLNKTEEEFERYLGFRPQLLAKRKPKDLFELSSNPGDSFDYKSEGNPEKGIRKEVKKANLELENIRWRVSKLVERDGITPCKTHLYLFQKDTIILNLYHPVIMKLVQLTPVNPDLAGHWAMAMCLLDEQNVLPHISAETREDLLMLDAMVRANGYALNDIRDEASPSDPFWDMLFRFGDNDLN